MSIRDVGSYIGYNRVTSTSQNSASGIWSLAAAERRMRAAAWPMPLPVPQTISGLQLWLDASDADTLYDATSGGSLVAADGGVARWEDKSGNSRHATQSDSSRRPARKTAVQGGKDVLRFDGSNDAMSIPSSTATFKFLHTSNATVFVVFKASGANPNTIYTLLENAALGGSTGYSLFYDDRVSVPRNDSVGSLGGVAAASHLVHSANGVFPTGTFHLVSNLIKSTDGTASNRNRIYKNGVIDAAVNSATGSTTNNASFDLFIGAEVSSPPSFALNGDIAEILIYDSALSDANREAVENYLLAKWAIT